MRLACSWVFYQALVGRDQLSKHPGAAVTEESKIGPGPVVNIALFLEISAPTALRKA
jgi:hypothetical protein